MDNEELKMILLDSISNDNSEQLKHLLSNHHSIDIANAISDYNDELLKKFFYLINSEKISNIIEKSNSALRKKTLELLDESKSIDVLSYLPSDTVTDILGTLSIYHRKNLMEHMLSKNSKEIEMLLGFCPDTAGGIMTTQYIALRDILSIKDALEKIKSIAPKTEVIETIYITDTNNKLIGTADLRDILISPESAKLSEIMAKNAIFVFPDTDQEDVSLIVSKYDLNALPVVNKNHVILGIITTDDVIDVIVEEQTEDLLMLSGVNKNEKVGSKLSLSISRRLPWLFVNLLTAFLASFTVGLFEDIIVQVSALAVAMPIVAGMGGNAGTQTLSIVIRSIALGQINIKKDWKYVYKEISIGLINGTLTGMVTALILYLKYSNFFLSSIIFIAMIGNLIIGSFFGFTIPLVLKKMKLDPAVSSSIFLTTGTDVGGFFIFLGLAKHFLPNLL